MKIYFGLLISIFLGATGFASTDEESTIGEKDIEANLFEMVTVSEPTEFPIDYPERNSDVDVDRIKYLARSVSSKQIMPKDIARSIKQVGGDQAMRTYRNTLALGAVATTGLLSSYFIPCGLLEFEGPYCSSASLYGFELSGVVFAFCSSYLAQNFYEAERSKFEESRNKHQDNLRQLEHIYQDISKALFRNYLSNLYLARENISESGSELGEKLEQIAHPQGEKALDDFLYDLHDEKEQLLLFDDILGFLANLDYVFREMLHKGVPEYTVRSIKLRFDQLSNLIIGKNYTPYKQNLMSLIFNPEETSRVKKRLSINFVITSEDLNSMLPQ